MSTITHIYQLWLPSQISLKSNKLFSTWYQVTGTHTDMVIIYVTLLHFVKTSNNMEYQCDLLNVIQQVIESSSNLWSCLA